MQLGAVAAARARTRGSGLKIVKFEIERILYVRTQLYQSTLIQLKLNASIYSVPPCRHALQKVLQYKYTAAFIKYGGTVRTYRYIRTLLIVLSTVRPTAGPIARYRYGRSYLYHGNTS